MNPLPDPSISIVVTARNDNHGGDLLRRMQIFVNGLLEQARRHGLNAELILVDWNPPPDRPSLAQALSWPDLPGPCAVRIIEVPPEIHRRFKHSDKLPLFQMIAKNVGIRRARGRFVLAANIDLLFSDHLVRFLASGRLDPRCMYRVDRHDVSADVPTEAPVNEQLEFCRGHVIRVNRRQGTFTREELHWSSAPRQVSLYFRWAARRLQVWLPQWPQNESVLDPRVILRFFRNRGDLITRWRRVQALVYRLQCRSQMTNYRINKRRRTFSTWSSILSTAYRGKRTFSAKDLRGSFVLRRAFRRKVVKPLQQWLPQWPKKESVLDPRVIRRFLRNRGDLIRRWQWVQAINGWARDWPRSLVDPIRPRQRVRAINVWARDWVRSLVDPIQRWRRARALHYKAQSRPQRTDARTRQLHTNACGDFTLLSRERWFELRGYPELEMFSIHLDSVLCHMAYHSGAREVVLGGDMRLYHVEHASGWSPKEVERLVKRMNDLDVPLVEWPQYHAWVAHMREEQRPIIFNKETWGLALENLNEAEICPGRIWSATPVSRYDRGGFRHSRTLGSNPRGDGCS